MRIRLGLAPQLIDSHPEAKLLWATGIFPTTPLLSTEDWNAIVEYYLKSAPESPLAQDPRPEIQPALRHFTAERPKYRRPIPSTTLVKVNQANRQIYMGDAETQSIDILQPDTSLIESIKVGNVPVAMTASTRGLYVTSIGRFQPSEDPRAELVFLERNSASFLPGKSILKALPRTTHSEFSDLNHDGKIDFIMCMYGNNAGRLSWFENRGQDVYQEQVLIAKSGAIRTEVHDFNGDGFRDVAALLAQESESFFIFMNDGKGNFSPELVFQKHPLMGHTYFEMADFNKDGRLDFVITNGDNGEYPSPLKKYHGVRIYLNRGGNRFDEAFFFPMNGAFKAVPRDFDKDGDLDIAAISFFPDYSRFPDESFVYLENQGDIQFTAATFPQCVMGRWLTMDVGDLDGDDDLEIVLGSYIRGPSPVPAVLARDWQAMGPSVLVLRNHVREPK